MAGDVTVLLFATARVAAGTPRLRWSVGRQGVSARSLVRALGESYPQLVPTLRSSRFVLNGQYLSTLTTKVRPGDEFAVHPPYGGG
ncbi:MAG TPA: MoaD/ThiS family protein [Thermoplasmata archaeon]|nr:MoaD/ThiS family protein [Thermoplasmata archaeon]